MWAITPQKGAVTRLPNLFAFKFLKFLTLTCRISFNLHYLIRFKVFLGV